jgi:hypothetical protein
MKTKIFLAILLVTFMTASCSANANVDEPFTLKKNESKKIGEYTIKMLGVGHTIEQSGHTVYANLEISGKGKVDKPTLDVGEAVSIGEKFLQLEAVSEKADPKLSDPFAATSCTLVVKNENPNKKTTPIVTPTPTATPTISKIKPTLRGTKTTKIKLWFGKKSAVINLDETDNVMLGGEGNHRYKLFFAVVKEDKIYYLFQVQSGSAMSNPMGPCGGDAPQTLFWLKTDLNLKVEQAKSEVFASCAYNGGRYLQGKVQLMANTLNLIFQQQLKKTEISYNTLKPENGFEIKEQTK